MAAACFAGGLGKTTAQEQEPFVWMTNTNGITWKQPVESTINQSNNEDLVKIVVPESVVLSSIDIDGCVNLTNLVIHTDPEKQKAEGGELLVRAADSGLRNITIQPGLAWQVRIEQKRSDSDYLGIFVVAVTFAEPPKLEIRTFQGTSGLEVEVVWRESSLQAADNVDGSWKDIPAQAVRIDSRWRRQSPCSSSG